MTVKVSQAQEGIYQTRVRNRALNSQYFSDYNVHLEHVQIFGPSAQTGIQMSCLETVTQVQFSAFKSSYFTLTLKIKVLGEKEKEGRANFFFFFLHCYVM